MAKYSYNKTVLEEIPENYITKYFPYRILLEYASWQDDGMASPYTLMLSDQPFMVESQAEMGLVVGAQIGNGAHLAMGEYNIETEEYAINELAEPTEDMVLPLEIGIFTLLWTSHDVMNITDNTVYMAGTEPVLYLGKKYQISEFTLNDIGDAIRTKTETTDLLTPAQMASKINEIVTEIKVVTNPNIAFGTTEPTDTSKLWLKTNEAYVDVSSEYETTLQNKSETRIAGYAYYDIGATCVGDKIYFFGGKTNPSIDFDNDGQNNTITTFNIKTNATEALTATLPLAIHSMGVANVGTKIYIFGGSYDKNAYRVDTIHMFDTETNTLTTLDAKLHTNLSDFAVAAYGTKIYIFGGNAGYSTDVIQVFDTENNTISTLDIKLPAPRESMSSDIIGSKVYIFGGMDYKGTNSTYYKDVLVFDIETSTFETLSTALPSNLMKAARLKNEIYLFSYSGTEYNEYYGVYAFNPETQEFKTTDFEHYKFVSPVVVSTNNGIFYNFKTYIYSIKENIVVSSGTIKILSEQGTFRIINYDNYNIDIGIKGVYLGNSSNIGKPVEAFLYKDGAWTPI